MSFTHKLKIICLIFFGFMATSYLIAKEILPNKIDYIKAKLPPPIPVEGFSPSNARTADGKVIPADSFFSAKRCAACHQETHAQWSESLHRNSAREPFYKESVDILEKTRGIEFTQHCEACHAPISAVSGALRTGSKESRTMDDEGVTCTVCHSITEARLDGTGSYTIRRPALLVKEDGVPVEGDVSDQEILANIPDHKRAMLTSLHKMPEFCATCHKASAPPELNNYKFIRGFNVYDEWQMSGASTETVTPYYRRENRADCRTCHMPQYSEGRSDMAANNGTVASHRFLGANTTTPLFYGQKKQAQLTAEFLQNDVLSADIFALQNETSGQFYPLLRQNTKNSIKISANEELTAELVIFNRRAAHSFPPELRDMYEPWVEFEATDARGNKLFHSGFLKPDKTLDESAHVYKAILLDSDSRVVTRHQVWTSVIKAYDNFIPPGRPDIVRYRFSISEKTAFPISLRVRVNYRRFIHEYGDYVLAKYNASNLEPPIVKMAETKVVLDQNDKEAVNQSPETAQNQAKRWNDYGIGLLEQSQASRAAAAFREASRLAPENPDYPTSAAIAEMQIERFAFDQREQLQKAQELITSALRIKPDFPRALFYQALIFRAMGKQTEAESGLSKLAAEHPRDREILRQLGQTLYGRGKIDEAKLAYEKITKIDPTDANAWQFLEPIYLSLGKIIESQEAGRNYLLWRNDPQAEIVATRFYAQNPNWGEERIPAHFYSIHSPLRPTATGPQAAPVK